MTHAKPQHKNVRPVAPLASPRARPGAASGLPGHHLPVEAASPVDAEGSSSAPAWQEALLAGDEATLLTLRTVWNGPDAPTLEDLVGTVAQASAVQGRRWMALNALMKDRGIAWDARFIPEVKDPLWHSLFQAAHEARPTLFRALLKLGEAWDVPLDLRTIFLAVVSQPGSGCVKTLAARMTPSTRLRGLVRALRTGHRRGYSDVWNNGRDWSLQGTPVDGFENVGPFPVDALLAAARNVPNPAAMDWLTERGAQWLPHEAALRRAALGGTLAWLERRFAVERPVYEREVLLRQANAVLDDAHGPADEPPVRGRARL